MLSILRVITGNDWRDSVKRAICRESQLGNACEGVCLLACYIPEVKKISYIASACLVLLMPASCVAWPSTAIAPVPEAFFPGEDLDGAPFIEEDGIGAAALSDGTNRDTCLRMIRCSSLFVTPDLHHQHRRRQKQKSKPSV